MNNAPLLAPTSPARMFRIPGLAGFLFHANLPRRLAWLVFVLGAGLVARPCAAAPGEWEFTGSLNTARVPGPATLLPNGTVLVSGGDINNSGNATATAEIYNPNTGRWTFTGSMAEARYLRSATLLANGKVLVAGGYPGTNTPLASAELYDPSSGTWSTTGSLNVARSVNTATLLPNGMVLVAGGLGDDFESLASAELYDPATGTWSTTGSLNTDRNNHTATLLPNGMVLVAGGAQGLTNISLKSAELYDPGTGTWSYTGDLNARRRYCDAALLPDGRVLVAGGIADTNLPLASADLYNPETGTWSLTGSLSDARFSYSTTLLPNGVVLVAGGLEEDFSGHNYIELASAELYDPAKGTWSTTGSLNTARAAHTATLLPNGMVLAAAGAVDNYSFYLASAELYDPGIVPATTVKGSGFINGQGDQASFTIRAKLTGDRVSGSFSFSDAGAGVTITAAKIRHLSINGSTAHFNGKADLGGGNQVIFNVSAVDNGPGTSDTLSITISNGYSAGGTLIDGNIRIQ